MHIVELIGLISIIIYAGFYLAYLAICLRYGRKTASRTPHELRGKSPSVSILIPTYNEAAVLERKFMNLRELTYPKDRLEAVFVDGASTDGTYKLLKDLSKSAGMSIKILQQSRRRGFNNAIIEGFVATTGEIICITGAETEYDSEAVSIMVNHFADPGIGAVTGRQMVRVEDGYSSKLEVAYRSLYDIVREAESNIDSPFDIKGEISAARRHVVEHLVQRQELSNIGCIDCCISFQAKIDGYRTIYEPKAVYWELAPGSIGESFKQQTRRAATLIQNMLAFKTMILNRKYGLFGMLIMPAHLLMLVILPLVLVIGSLCLIATLVLDPTDIVVPLFWAIATLTIVFSRHIQAFLKTQISLFVATLRLLFGVETQKFERIQSTRN